MNWPLTNDFHTFQFCNFSHLLLIKNINVPSIMSKGFIFENLKNIPCFFFFQYFPSFFFIKNREKLTLIIQKDFIKRCFNRRKIYVKKFIFSKRLLFFLCIIKRLKINSFKTHRWHFRYFDKPLFLFLLTNKLQPLSIMPNPFFFPIHSHPLGSIPICIIHYRISILFFFDKGCQCILFYFLCYFIGSSILCATIFIYLANRRARYNIMKLISKNDFPSLC